MNWEKWPIALLSVIVAGLPLTLMLHAADAARLTGFIAFWTLIGSALMLFTYKVYILNGFMKTWDLGDAFFFSGIVVACISALITTVSFLAILINSILALAVFLGAYLATYGVLNGFYEDWRKVKRVP